ncbi:hypothetical protein ASE00_10835 [Sphingomonas sp. Root710]|uniref:glycosyltransferase family 2 protein n=1 Tax=Sphingomonas sp. Root710 TaxID=1736594 RepID=UPI0006FDCEE9|nr:glycosyltransferase family 2 protein [Sphingomonas sp. Root710]KRB82539.1 hypothetical protein ASE00_10835 [Sphingomonas sp. Root710]
MSRTDIAAVVIGRNEGARLDCCLASLDGLLTIYVDSGSTDGSPGRARAAGVEVIELDPRQGYSAARGRNAGLVRLIADPAIAYVQMLDGDCVLAPGWISAGAAALDAEPELGAISGELREADPDASLYAWLCDIEWSAPPGPVPLFAGNVLLRADAVRRTGFYRPGMIAGEDPDYAIRMREAGWKVGRIAEPMAVHSAGIARFGQWWRRTVRAGHAFAELTALHPRSPLHDFGRSRRRILFWGGAVPFAALAGLILAAVVDPRWALLSGAALFVTLAQMVRVGLREMRHHRPRPAFTLALFLGIGKYAEMIGLLRYHLSRRPRAS